MSYKVPCERCGKKIVYRERNILSVNELVREEPSNVSTTTSNVKVVYERRERVSYPICDECVKKFEKFMAGAEPFDFRRDVE